jgi:hypothetical protein
MESSRHVLIDLKCNRTGRTSAAPQHFAIAVQASPDIPGGEPVECCDRLIYRGAMFGHGCRLDVMARGRYPQARRSAQPRDFVSGL